MMFLMLIELQQQKLELLNQMLDCNLFEAFKLIHEKIDTLSKIKGLLKLKP